MPLEPGRAEGRDRRQMKLAKPLKANGIKQLIIMILASNRESRSHGDELVVESVGYGDFRPVLGKVATNRDVLHCRFVRAWFGKANKPKQSQDT